MKKKYIKFYGEHDLSTGIDIVKVENFIEKFLIDPQINSLNSAIELYNVLKFIEIEYFKDNKSEININFKESAFRLLNQYFSKSGLIYFKNEYMKIDNIYKQDFWSIFTDFNIIKKTDFKDFEKFIKENNISIHNILFNKGICDKYNIFVKHELLSKPQNFELFIDKYDSLSNNTLNFNISFTNTEINDWARRYCDLEDVNINYVERISNWSMHHEIKLDLRVIIKAKNLENELTEKIFRGQKGYSWKIQVGFKNNIKNDYEIVDTERIHDFIFYFNKDWLDDEQDFSTILNNFIYFFGFFNNYFQFSMIESPYKKGDLIDFF